MTVLERTVVEMKQRSGFLGKDVDLWRQKARANADGFGVHQSQLDALGTMMDTLQKKQTDLLQTLASDLPQTLASDLALRKFAMSYSRLAVEIVGATDLWHVFRYIYSQLQDSHLGGLLDAANRIAADCYLNWLDRADIWHLLPEGQRQPPLVYLEATSSAAIANRGVQVQELGFSVQRYGSLRLPIPIVILPFDHLGVMWYLCALHHEVGHSLDQDLGLSSEFKQHLESRVGADRLEVWVNWAEEILADALAVLSGGAGFAHGLAAFLFPLAPRAVTFDTRDAHPDHYLRILLLAEMLERTGVADMQQTVNEIRDLAAALPAPNGVAPFLLEYPAVAEMFLTQPLQALGKRALLDLNPDLAGETKEVAKLARYLRTNLGFDKPISPLPPRLVPVAAERALRELGDADETAIEELNKRAYTYLSALKRPAFLAGADHSDFYRQLSQEIVFTEVA